MKKDYNFYVPDLDGITLYKVDHWCNYLKAFYGQKVSPKTDPYDKFKIDDNLLKDVAISNISNYALYDEYDEDYQYDMYIFNIGSFKNAIYIYNELTNYFER